LSLPYQIAILKVFPPEGSMFALKVVANEEGLFSFDISSVPLGTRLELHPINIPEKLTISSFGRVVRCDDNYGDDS